jgi:hypothetical protein
MNPYFVLVNKTHPVPADFLSCVELVPVCDIHHHEILLERCTFAAYEALAACVQEKENVIIGVSNGYRSLESQQQIYNRFCEKYGKDYADAIVFASENLNPRLRNYAENSGKPIMPYAGEDKEAYLNFCKSLLNNEEEL